MFAANVFDHVLDSGHWGLFENLGLEFHLPASDKWYGLTKYKVLMVIAAVIILWIFIPLARRARTGEPPRGVFWNFFESILTFIRDNIAKPYLSDPHAEHHAKEAHGHGTADAHAAAGHTHAAPATSHSGHGSAVAAVPDRIVSSADKYVPFLWTVFLFILVCNLLGLVPFGGSPTGSMSVTVALAGIAFLMIHGAAIAKMGFGHYLQSQIPSLDLPTPLKIAILILLVPIEFMGHFIKAFVLAVRLFANVFAGHMVLALLLMFIVMVKNEAFIVFWGVTGVTVLGVIALSFLELFVAFLQAYIFTFLTALFMGAALNPEH